MRILNGLNDAAGRWCLGHVTTGTVKDDRVECYFAYDNRKQSVALKDIRAAQLGARAGGRRRDEDEAPPFAPTLPEPSQVVRNAQQQAAARRDKAIGKITEWHPRARKRSRWHEIL